ncbi:MAG TPA: ABC transporter ATP-binding protein [Planctomycetota bacterium]|jgi:iron(III) transport system ATP-binding protein
MSLQIDNLRVTYGKTRALDGVSLKLEPGEMFFLLGPSGCGKSTLLRAVAGFVEDFDGEIRIGGEALKGVPPHKRDFGMVFQNYALFPHLTVQGNVSFGLEARKMPAAERSQRIAEALDMVGLSGFESRRPGELSGGQQQRVALARALVVRPRVLLLDEPLSNLDAKLRWEMREEIRRIHRQTKITTLYVTHDQKEALSLADRMAILRAGKVEALGQPRELYRHPPTRFAAEFLGDVNALPGKVCGGGKSVQTAFGAVPISNGTQPGLSDGSEVLAFCRPESVVVMEPGAALSPALVPLQAKARIVSGAFLGESTLYEMELPGAGRWRVLRHEHGEQALGDNAQVQLAVAAEGWAAVP